MGNLPEVVVVHIAGMLSKEQPDAHATMARVCPNWRWAILDEPRLWRSLTLDLRRPTDKARVFRYYSKKRLREIKFTDRFDSTRAPAISDILIDSVGHVKCLAVKQNQIGPAFQDQFRSLESLHLTGSAGNVLDLEFIHPTAVPIRDLKLASTMLSLVQPGQGGPDHLDSGVRTRLSTASSVTMSDSYVSLHTPDDRQDAAHAAFLQYLRSAREIFLENVFLIPLQFVPTGPNIPGGIVQNAVRIDLPLLEIYEEPAANFTSDRPLFDLVHAPNLQKLLLWNLNAGFQARALDQLTAPGLAAALPNLVALDIGKSAVEQPQLLRVLNVMKSLRFLNVSFCGVDNGFLDAIQLKVGVPDSEQMLPHLTALSIAGHEAVTSAAVRDFLNSRLPGGEKIPVRVEKPATKGPSMFKPTAPKLDKGKGRAATQTSTLLGSQMRGPSMQSLRSIPVSTQPPSTYPLTQPAANLPVNPRIDWLNIDLCENVQATAVDWWRPKVRFLSHQPGAPDYDRIRGKGQWSWDSEWTEDCPRGEGERGCHLRKVPGRESLPEILMAISTHRPIQQYKTELMVLRSRRLGDLAYLPRSGRSSSRGTRRRKPGRQGNSKARLVPDAQDAGDAEHIG